MADIQYRDGGRGGRLPWTIALILAWTVFIDILLSVLSILAGDLGFAEAERILGVARVLAREGGEGRFVRFVGAARDVDRDLARSRGRTL